MTSLIKDLNAARAVFKKRGSGKEEKDKSVADYHPAGMRVRLFVIWLAFIRNSLNSFYVELCLSELYWR